LRKIPTQNKRPKRVTNRYIGKDDVIAIFILSGNDPLKLHDVTPQDVERVRRRLNVVDKGGEKIE
jgi:hypothetical protein